MQKQTYILCYLTLKFIKNRLSIKAFFWISETLHKYFPQIEVFFFHLSKSRNLRSIKPPYGWNLCQISNFMFGNKKPYDLCIQPRFWLYGVFILRMLYESSFMYIWQYCIKTVANSAVVKIAALPWMGCMSDP